MIFIRLSIVINNTTTASVNPDNTTLTTYYFFSRTNINITVMTIKNITNISLLASY